EGIRLRTMDGGRTCFLELARGTAVDPNRAISYAAYDVSTKTVKTGLVIDHQAVDGCSQTIPLYPR
ncbi:MAG: hypothetical protein OTI36_01515, partial [Beijerinckiaceae bacterium]|nr:hypothetical protein [Beijerinckiaceae bacterium]